MINVWIMLFLEIALLYIAYYLNGKDFLSPSVITIVVFILSTLCIIYNHDHWAVNYHVYTVLVVVLGLLTATIADISQLHHLKKKRRFRNNLSYEIVPYKVDLLVNVVACIFLTLCLIVFFRKIMSLGLSIGARGLMSIGAVKDSTEVSIQGIPLVCYDIAILGSFVYMYLFFGNLVAGVPINKNLIYIYPVIIGLLAAILRGNRGALIQILFGAITVYVIVFRWKNGAKSINARTFVKRSFPVFALFSVAFYFLREIVKGRSVTSTFIDYFTYYLGSPLFLFDKYLVEPSKVYSRTSYWGGTTFANFYGYLYTKGVVNQPIGILNYTNVVPGTSSAGNEYCFFMRPYHDFGFVGMLVFTFIFFSVFSYFYYRLRNIEDKTKKNAFRVILFSYFYFMILMTFYYCFTAQEFRPQTLFLVFVLYLAYYFLIRRRIVFSRRRLR